jgi:hypothetical protein
MSAKNNDTINEACYKNWMQFSFDEDARYDGFVGATGATLVQGTLRDRTMVLDNNDKVEWESLDVLNLWFARLGSERLVSAGAEKEDADLDPFTTVLMMPVSPGDVRNFLEDARHLIDDPENPPALFSDNGDERYANLIDECDEGELLEVLDDIEAFIDRHPDTDFTYLSDCEEYDPDDFDE